MIGSGMPPEELLEPLPPKGIKPPERVDRPLVMIPDDAVGYAVQNGSLGLPAQVVAEEIDDPGRFVNTLIELEETKALLAFFSWTLPKREALWWAFDCCWDTILDHQRHVASLADPPKSGEGEGAGTSLDPKEKFRADLKEASKKLDEIGKNLRGDVNAGLAKLQASAGKIRQMAPPTKGNVDPVSALNDIQRITSIKTSTAEAARKIGVKPNKPFVIKFPSSKQAPKIKPPPGLPSPLALKIARREKEGRLRGLASSLQWIIDPCQDHAIKAKDALSSIHECPPVTALAKATFWCGENMSTDPAKPQVAPPPALPRKGIYVAINKSLVVKKTEWSLKDKTNWYLQKAIRIAEGRYDWSHANENFDLYSRWVLDD